MPDELNEVQPGDLITSEFINTLIRRVKELGTGTGGGLPITVPNLFSLSLGAAKSILSIPGTHLTLGKVLDAFGLTIDIHNTANSNRLVIHQHPPPDTKTTQGTVVTLVVSAAPGTSTGPGPQLPTITGIELKTPNAAVPPGKLPVGSEVRIIGTNFTRPPESNVVTFGGFQTQPPSTESSPFQLLFLAPTISNGPQVTGQELTVEVVVTTGAGSSAPRQVTLVPPLGPPLPRITSITPNPGILNNKLTIEAENLGSPTSVVRVHFGEPPNSPSAVPNSVGATSLEVTVPVLPVVAASDFPVSVNVFLQVGELMSPAFEHFFAKS